MAEQLMPDFTTEKRAGSDQAGALLMLLHRMEALKHLPRTGWVDREVEAPETVAAHSWRLAMMAWLVAEAQGLDGARAVRMALVHDLPEAVTGDRTPFDEHGATPQARRAVASDPPAHDEWRNATLRAAKHNRESAGLEEILSTAPPLAANTLRSAWEDYEAGESAEAQLVSQLDKLEAYLQGKEYAQAGRLPHAQTLASFQVDCDMLVTVPGLRAMLAALETLHLAQAATSEGENEDQWQDADDDQPA